MLITGAQHCNTSLKKTIGLWYAVQCGQSMINDFIIRYRQPHDIIISGGLWEQYMNIFSNIE